MRSRRPQPPLETRSSHSLIRSRTPEFADPQPNPGIDPKATFQRRMPNPVCNCSYFPLYPDILL